MGDDSWFILIYETADAESQAHLAEGLQSLGHMIVDVEQGHDDYFVVVECQDTTPAMTLHELVMAIDADAELVGTHGKACNGRRLEVLFG